jgi:uncharacterized protein YgiM (DUF1202 family)
MKTRSLPRITACVFLALFLIAGAATAETTDTMETADTTETTETAETAGSTATPAPAPSSLDALAASVDEARATDLEAIVELGTAYSTVNGENGPETVKTAGLTLGNVSLEYALAVIWAPKTGRVALRERASEKSDILKDCLAGRIVAVLTLAGGYTKIVYDGKEGYVRTDCLHFYAPMETNAPTGVLSFNGRATGKTTVNVRLEGDRESRKIGEYKTGTPIAVITAGETWTEIEVKGYRGYVMTKYLTVENVAPQTGE